LHEDATGKLPKLATVLIDRILFCVCTQIRPDPYGASDGYITFDDALTFVMCQGSVRGNLTGDPLLPVFGAALVARLALQSGLLFRANDVLIDERGMYFPELRALLPCNAHIMFNAFSKRQLHIVLKESYTLDLANLVLTTEVFRDRYVSRFVGLDEVTD